MVTDSGDNRWQQFNSSKVYQQQYSQKEVQGVAIDDTSGPDAGDAYVLNSATGAGSKISRWAPAPWPVSVPELPTPGTNAVTTIEYNVPLAGTGLPTMTASEVEQWGQTDDPVEATAIFPPDQPQSWPAQSYTRASLYYLDAKGRTVNTVGPTGGVSTAEYNTTNDVVRTLSADDRAAALKEGSKSKEKSKLLDTESTYNSEGTEVLSTLGPQHKVKLAKGKEKAGEEVLARNSTHYYYNEGAPAEGGPYDLVTRSTDAAVTESKEEFDTSETATSYSGQENLGWKLRKPTSVTTDPNGLKLTHAATYEAATGNVTETTTPAGVAQNPPMAYASQFGTKGTGPGQFVEPHSVAMAKNGNVLVLDSGNDRVEEFSQTGKYE